ncbi:BrnT family toxin [Salinarimonas sp.]|uniref:BrnT family toxin n=1 Tax=Salinarimonas sp. TaxID=2766526 RepID=UPI00391A9492
MNTPSSFEWDDQKAAANVVKHGIAFEDAIDVFKDPERLVVIDNRSDYGEERTNVIGAVDTVVLVVSCTMRGQSCRIISARRASRRERRAYNGDIEEASNRRWLQ